MLHASDWSVVRIYPHLMRPIGPGAGAQERGGREGASPPGGHAHHGAHGRRLLAHVVRRENIPTLPAPDWT
eukprot:949116-Prorocentrum_minimum.AAC.2